MTNHKLTDGILSNIMKGEEIEGPVLQVLGCKKMPPNKSSDKDRFRLLLSDGQFTISFAMYTTQVGDSDFPNGFTQFSIIKIKRYIISVIKGDTKVLLILNVEVLEDGSDVGQRIGSPVPLTDAKPEAKVPENSSPAPKPSPGPSFSNNTSNSSSKPVKPTEEKMDTSMDISAEIIHPISALTPYQNRWTIKARVVKKSPIRTWSNSRGEGKLFNIDLVDESGEIRLTGFRDAVDKFYEYLEVGKVYRIKKCQVKIANKQFSTLNNDYEMAITNETVIQLCEDSDTEIPQIKYNFISISEIEKIEPQKFIDLIGVCKSASPISTLIAKATQKELKKKEVVLVDQTNSSITLTLWNEYAENFDETNNPVVAVKGVKVSDFGGGKSVSTLNSSQISLNPDIEAAHRLRSWYDSQGHEMEAKNLSAKSGNFDTPWMSLKQVQEKKMGANKNGDFYQAVATVLLLRSEKCAYKACPGENCQKKVVDMGNGYYRCEKCSTETSDFKYRLIPSMNIADWSGNQWLNMFNNIGEQVFEHSAQEVGKMMEENPTALSEIAEKKNFKQYLFKCKSKFDIFNDEGKLRTTALKIEPINYKVYNSYLIGRIRELLEKA